MKINDVLIDRIQKVASEIYARHGNIKFTACVIMGGDIIPLFFMSKIFEIDPVVFKNGMKSYVDESHPEAVIFITETLYSEHDFSEKKIAGMISVETSDEVNIFVADIDAEKRTMGEWKKLMDISKKNKFKEGLFDLYGTSGGTGIPFNLEDVRLEMPTKEIDKSQILID